ncbi:YbaB/EbfC family nucleoid-associated protein [Nocardia sp. NPDC046763]|uniref:YbaB/EbfC family nucleoid-associated protein n=1 Tax=Nocardia sp. NPDC046763 TaxID=3155256 RepID=UPI0033D024C3
MNSPLSGRNGYTESLSTRMDRLAQAVTDSHVSLSSEGIHVDVRANGHIVALTVDDRLILDAHRLGPLIARLVNEARDQAQARLEDLVNEIQADPRIATIVEQLGDAPDRALPSPAVHDSWDDTYHDGPKSAVFGD